jgi:hypothetical protein
MGFVIPTAIKKDMIKEILHDEVPSRRADEVIE